MLFCILFFPSRLSFVIFFHHDFAHSCINFPFSVRKQMNNCKVDHRIWGAIRLYNDQGLREDLQPDLAQLLFLLLTYLWEKNSQKTIEIGNKFLYDNLHLYLKFQSVALCWTELKHTASADGNVIYGQENFFENIMIELRSD